MATTDTLQSFSFDRPLYSDGLAKDTLTTMIISVESGTRLTFKSTGQLCTLEKRENHWQLMACKSQKGFFVNHGP